MSLCNSGIPFALAPDDGQQRHNRGPANPLQRRHNVMLAFKNNRWRFNHLVLTGTAEVFITARPRLPLNTFVHHDERKVVRRKRSHCRRVIFRPFPPVQFTIIQPWFKRITDRPKPATVLTSSCSRPALSSHAPEPVRHLPPGSG